MHGTIIRKGITCKKISCHIPHSACRWSVVKKDKIFWSYVKHFWILADVREIAESWLVCVNLVPVSFSCFLDFSWKKLSFLESFTDLTVIISLYLNEPSYINCFICVAVAKTFWKIKLGEFKNDHNYFVR